MTKYHCDNCGVVSDSRIPSVYISVGGGYGDSIIKGISGAPELCGQCVTAVYSGARAALERAKTTNVIHRAAGKA